MNYCDYSYSYIILLPCAVLCRPILHATTSMHVQLCIYYLAETADRRSYS